MGTDWQAREQEMADHRCNDPAVARAIAGDTSVTSEDLTWGWGKSLTVLSVILALLLAAGWSLGMYVL